MVLDISSTSQGTEFDVSVEDDFTNIRQDSSIFSENTFDYITPSIELEYITKAPIRESIQAGDSQSESDYITSSSDMEYHSAERTLLKVPSDVINDGTPAKHEKKVLTTTSKKTDENYNNLSNYFVTDGTESSVQPESTQNEQDSSAYSEIGSENPKDSIKELLKGTDFEISSSSSQTFKELTTVYQESEYYSGHKKNNVPLPSEVITIAIPLNPENMSSTPHETEEDYLNQLNVLATEGIETNVDDNYLDSNEDSKNITKNEIDTNTEADERFSYFGKNLRAEDQKKEKSTNLLVNDQKNQTQDLKELKKITNIIDKNMKPSINTKTGEQYNGDNVYSTFLQESKLNSLESDLLVDHLLTLSGNSYEENASFEMNQNITDDRLGNTDIGEYPTDELFINVEKVYDCLENITCLSELYANQSGTLFNETESLNEETTEQHNFDVQSLNEDDKYSIESIISNETDHDYNVEMIPESYNETILYDEKSTKDNITRLAETAQIISHEVPRSKSMNNTLLSLLFSQDSDHETKYTLEWLVFSPSPITECTVKFRLYDEGLQSLSVTDNDDDWLFFTASVTQDGEDTFVGKVTLEHLLPGQRYIVHIASKNAHQYNTFSEQFLFTTKEEADEEEESSYELTKTDRIGSTTISPELQRSTKKPLRKVNHSVSDISLSSAIRILSYKSVCLILFLIS